ncbi:hypothetical protein [Streptomyces resistomycificus]|uniref:Uncharacterized protein n=1 Tax=Streptomyces resistomycificus TaxID=67356 RepID=A0A0L8KVW1_9ACTN|nr:hypothetical protein [Streptomyces resistomycificus]KOG30081.1 hypothetical protein ADK37_35470 [Streptomyces resistomycificus]KUN98146.1 hypothetical protein AQJ84_15735 [Streptomyces resistomycificus]
MLFVLVWSVRLCALGAWVATAVACTWLLGVAPTPQPWNGPVVWGAVAAGCAVVRALLLWVLRVPASVAWWRRRRLRGAGTGTGAVSLSKERENNRGRWDDWSDWEDAHELSFPGDEIWTKLRTAAVWVLVAFASGAVFVGMWSVSEAGGKAETLRDAGAEVSAATVVLEPGKVRADVDDENVVRGYSSRLVVSVPGGPERLTVKGAYTLGKPRKGDEVDVLWARSATGLGGYVHEDRDLPMIAEGRWKAFPDTDSGGMMLFAFILVAVVFGAVLTPVFTLVADADDLQELAWSPLAQTVRAALTAGVFLGWRPLLLGEDPHVVELLFAGGGFFLVLIVYILTSMRSLR